jgi:two-component system response regulator MtrA
MNARILVVDDDPAIAEMIGIVLRAEGFEPQFAGDGQAALDLFRAGKADLVLLDLMLPGMDGIEVCAHIRAESGVPIIMLTAKGDASDVVRGLESGADDYVVKPFNPKELVARIRTRLRPTLPTSSDAIGIGDLVIDVAGHEVRRGDGRINLTRSSSSCCWHSRPSRSRSSRARCCSNRSGVITTKPTRGWSMCTCSDCGRRSSTIPTTRGS